MFLNFNYCMGKRPRTHLHKSDSAQGTTEVSMHAFTSNLITVIFLSINKMFLVIKKHSI